MGQDKKELLKQLQNEVEVLARILHVKKFELEQLEREMMPTIEEKIQECKEHGFTVTRNRKWLWLDKFTTDYSKEGESTVAGIKVNTVDKSEEDRILLKLGFRYSSNRMNWYYISEK